MRYEILGEVELDLRLIHMYRAWFLCGGITSTFGDRIAMGRRRQAYTVDFTAFC